MGFNPNKMPGFNELLILMVVVWTSGKIFKSIGLPVVFGELLGGILVGPALLNLVPADSEMIKVLAELGIFFLMLHSGLETNPKELLYSSKKSLVVALGGVIVPFIMGYYVSIWFGQSFEAALFIAMGLSVTAIPLASRIFKETGIQNTRVAHVALGAAVIDDILALIIFSVVLSLAETGSIELIPLLILLLKISAFFGVVMVAGFKTSKFLNRVIYFGNKGFTLTLIIALLMGLIAEAMQLHMIIGAFLAGLFIREEIIDNKTFNKIEDRVYGLSYGFFGPIFFASLAFHLDFTAFKTAPIFLITIIAAALIGKIIGSGGTALAVGLNKLEAMIVGLSMNNRAAVELIVAAIGLEKGIIDRTVFSILVVMAFTTTLIAIVGTTPFAKKLKAQKASQEAHT